MNVQHTTKSVLQEVTRARVGGLQARYLANDGGAVATLAQLRRCDPAVVGANPSVWAVTLADLPPELTHVRGRESVDPTPAEQALHATLSLYAVHQQSQTSRVHVLRDASQPTPTFGRAVGRLARARAVDEELDSSTVRRLQQAALATTPRGRLIHITSLIKLMRAESPAIPFDYGLFAGDLWTLFDPYQDQTPVLVRWARDLHSPITSKTNDAPNEETK